MATTSTKISGLSAFNVKALRETHADSIAEGNLVLTATTATWNVPAAAALAKLEGVMISLPGKGHPRASLHAVVRKLRFALTEQSTAAFMAEVDEASGIPADEPAEPTTATESVVEQEQAVFEAESEADFVGALPYDQAFEFYLDMPYHNLFAQTSREDEYHLSCKACGEIVKRGDTKDHHAAHRAYRAQNMKETKMATATKRNPKAKTPTAKDQGFPAVYLAPNGNFKPGYDAAAKGDLVCAFLGVEKKDARHTFTKAEAEKLLKARNWMSFVAKKQTALANAEVRKAAAAAKRTSAAKTKAASKKKTSSRKTASASKPQAKPDPKPASSRKRSSGRSGLRRVK